MITILHGADFHLDAPFSGLSPEAAVRRRGEQRQLLERFAALAREKKPDLVVLSGDLFDQNRTYYETTQALAQALGSIPAPVFLAPGNHDWYSPRSPYASIPWPDNVHVFRSAALERVAPADAPWVVYGGAFTSPVCETSLLAHFQPAEEDGTRVRVMVLHGDVEGNGSYNPITLRELEESGMDYVALGHVHSCSGLCRAGRTSYAYPGCPEGRGFDETGEKGVVLVEAEKGQASLTFFPLSRRQYRDLTVSVTGRTPREAVEEALNGVGAEDVVRLRLTGEADLGTVDLAGWQGLSGRCASLEVRDETTVSRDLWERRGEDSLTGLFLTELARRMDGAGPADRRLLERAARFGLAALEGGEER